ncbi:MAG: histidine kinase [Nocardiopsaceae bacterium]|nr:histidine kinase [Nocardiopsaceae bacterium]
MRLRTIRIPGTAADIVLAAAVGVAVVTAELVFAAHNGEPLTAFSFMCLAAGSASLAALNRYPMLTAFGIAVATPLYYMFGPVDAWIAWLMLVAGVIRLAAVGHRTSAITATVVLLAVFAAGEFVQFELWRALSVLAWSLVVLSVGEIARSRRAYLNEVEQRAAEAERTREEEARRRATEERLHIARELHDVIAHNISLINVQAGAAAHRRDPEQAYAALNAIKQASKETLRELRSTLGVLRQVDEGAAPITPAPSLSQLGDLVAQTTQAGLPTEYTVEGAEVPLPVPVDTAAYRIVQESLTNAVRHADADSATVSVRYGSDITVQVDDDGRALPVTAVQEGNGLRGMRERAAAVGGEITAGLRPEGGFRVRAILPLDGGAGTTSQ